MRRHKYRKIVYTLNGLTGVRENWRRGFSGIHWKTMIRKMYIRIKTWCVGMQKTFIMMVIII